MKRKMSALLLAVLFVASAGGGLIVKIALQDHQNLTEGTAKPYGVMDPGGIPHYFGPYANYANSPVPTGAVTDITVTSGGSGYSSPVVTISDVWGTGSGASATAVVTLGAITGISINSGGSGYSAPAVSITDPTGSGATATASIGGTLSGGIRKFVDSLPGLGEANANNLGNYISIAVPDTTTYPGCDYFEIALVKYVQKVHTDLPETLFNGYVQLETPAIAAYSKHIALKNPDGSSILMPDGSQAIAVDNPSYLGPTIVASRDIPTRVTFYNLLPTGSGGNLFLPVDTTYMGAGMGPLDMIGMPGMKENYTENRATLHLHGGATPWISDGTPHQWTTPAGEMTQYPKGVSVEYVPDMWFVNGTVVPNTVGVTDPPVVGATTDPGNGTLTFYYTNQQSARLMFYHDHAYGITRLNVYSGEAAPYLLTDSQENDLVNQGILPSLAGEYLYGIPLVIQDKTFVDANTIAYQDPTWAWGSTAPVPHTGDLWMPHVYMPNQNPYDVSGANPYGRWDYGPWFFPPTPIQYGPVPNPYYDPINAPWEPPMIPGVPKVSAGMEAFMDTPMVNGEAYPYLNVEPQAYRFRILNAANDRFFNLQMYVADPNIVTSDGRTNTEINMVPALSTPGFPALWPSDGRVGGVPNPQYMGPSWVQIGTEGGFLPAPVEIPNQPVTWNYNMKTFNFGNVQDHSLLLGTAERADVVVDFSQFAGKTIILYNDAPAGFPAYDPRADYYTGDGDNTGDGGAPTTQAGYGPNTRTIMQIRVANNTAAPAYDTNALKAAWASTPGHPGVFETSQDPILVPQAPYDSAYNATFSANAYVHIQDTNMTFTTLTGTTLTIPFEPKAIHDEMGGTYDTIYGRMMGSLGLEVPSGTAVTQMFIPLGYASPPVDILTDSMTPMSPVLGDGTQIWKITHNGVDTHTIHWHLFNVQLINRVAWDNTLMIPDANELGWKETVRVDPLSDTILAMRPVAPILPWEVPSSIREIDPTLPDGEPLLPPAGGFIDPNANPVTVNNHLVNFGWEYVFHCHLLEHEEMDMMHSMPFVVAPYAPRNLTATFDGSSVNMTWIDKSIAETGYMVQRSTNSGPWSTIETLNSDLYTIGPTKGSTLYYNDSSVSGSTIYSYRVMAITTVGDTTDYGGGAGYPSVTVNSTPSNEIIVNTGTGIVTILSLPPPPGGGTPPGSPPPFTYRSPLPLQVVPPSGSTSHVSHAPIRINSNADFNPAHGVTSGSGTALSPWIIENLAISGTGVGYGIYIGNTTDHFIVRNNVLENASSGTFRWQLSPDSGLVLNNVVNGVAAYNSLSMNAWSGMYVEGSQNVTLFNNTLSGSYMGIYLKSASNNTIASNNISDTRIGMWLYKSDSNGIFVNTMARNFEGMVLAASNGNTITNSSFYLNGYYALRMHASGHGYIHDNDLVSNHGSTGTRSPAHLQAYDDTGTNRWNTTTRGNHWSDWTSPDANLDGIVDVPYLIGGAGAMDHYPLVQAIKPEMLTTIVVTPSPVSVILGSTQVFAAQGLSQYGAPMTGLTISWSSNVGTMTGDSLKALAAAGTVGYVRATSGVVSGDAIVTVILGPLTYINVTPASVNVVAGGLQLFSAIGTDAYYNTLSGLVFNWTTTVGAISSFGLLTAQGTSGVTGYVNASVGAVTGSSLVTIIFAQLNHIVVSPSTASVAAGSTLSLTAAGFDMFNNSIPGLTFTWSTDIGTMTGANLTAQTTAGITGYVMASSNDVMGFAFVTIVPAALDHIDLIPLAVTVAVGSQTQFLATGKDVYNNTISGLVFTWTSTLGSVNSTGMYTAPNTPEITALVNASSGGKTGTATVNVIFVQVLTIIVTPTPVSVAAGADQAFSAVAYDQFNTLVPGVTFNWTSTVGSMNGSVMTAVTVAGVSGYVTAENGSSYGRALVTVVPNALSVIDVIPPTLNTLAGMQTQFLATGKDAYNNVISGLTFNWTTDVGTITQSGLFTAQSTPATTGYVNASVGAVTGSAAVNIILNNLSSIVVTPSIVNVTAGATQAFSAVGYDLQGSPMTGLTFTWSTNVGTMTGSNLTAQAVAGAIGFVRASIGSTYADALVTVVPGPLDHIDLTPSALTAVAGSATQFLAVGRDVLNNAISGLTYTWTTNVGGVSVSGLFTAQTLAGASGYVNASVGLVTGTASVSIVPDQLTHIVVTPSPVNVVAGLTQGFSASGFDQYNNALSGLVFVWSTNVGSMIGSVLTAQPLAGVSGYVRATVGSVYSDASVSVVAGTLHHIDVVPGALAAVAGSQTQFTAVGRDALNNAISGLTFSWTTIVGTVSSSGLFTAQSVANVTGYVNATSGSVTGSSIVTITEGQLTYIVVTPGPLNVAAGASQVFVAVGYDQLNNTIPGLAFVWTSNIGTMVGSTLTAQTVAGATGYVNAASGSVSGLVLVTVVSAALDHIDVTPSALNAIAGTQTQFTAVGMDVYNNTVSGLTFTWTTTVGIITGSGLFTAQNASGALGYVNASSGAVTGSAAVAIVVGQLTYIVVTPSTASVAAGGTQAFSAVGYDSLSNPISGLTFSWSASIGTMTVNVLTAQTASGATGLVTATYGFVTGTSLVTIIPGALDHIDVIPTPVNVVAGSQTQFLAAGKDVYNNSITGSTFSWTTTVGTISSSGLLTAQISGGVTGYANASSGLVTGSASVSVIVINSPPIIFPLGNSVATIGVAMPVFGMAVDQDLDPLRYTWDFGDGTPLVVGQSVSHNYAKPGTYNYTLYVDDQTGITGHNVSSTAVITVPLVLHILAGWNFVSVPIQGSVYMASTLGLSFGDTVVGWNPATQSYDQSFIVGLTPLLFDFSIQPSTGYWVYASGPRTLYLNGSVPTVQQSRVITVPTSGWASIGLSSYNSSLTASSIVSMYTGGSVTTIVGWDAATQSYFAYIVGFPFNDFALVPGQAYWVFVTGSGTLAYNP